MAGAEGRLVVGDAVVVVGRTVVEVDDVVSCVVVVDGDMALEVVASPVVVLDPPPDQAQPPATAKTSIAMAPTTASDVASRFGLMSLPSQGRRNARLGLIAGLFTAP